MNKVPLLHIRQVLQNIERFRSDALKLPEIINKTTSHTEQMKAFTDKNEDNGGASGIYGAGARSAGSINGPDAG